MELRWNYSSDTQLCRGNSSKFLALPNSVESELNLLEKSLESHHRNKDKVSHALTLKDLTIAPTSRGKVRISGQSGFECSSGLKNTQSFCFCWSEDFILVCFLFSAVAEQTLQPPSQPRLPRVRDARQPPAAPLQEQVLFCCLRCHQT